MIVLDEQLLASDLGKAIRRWYRGQVIGITQLRPGTLIKDDSIAPLLHKARSPIFVTINVDDFLAANETGFALHGCMFRLPA